MMRNLDHSLNKPKHNHYHKDVSKYKSVDVYAICKIFGVQDESGCIQHAIKKLLVAGGRGYKDRQTDLQNVVDTIERLIEIESQCNEYCVDYDNGGKP